MHQRVPLAIAPPALLRRVCTLQGRDKELTHRHWHRVHLQERQGQVIEALTQTPHTHDRHPGMPPKRTTAAAGSRGRGGRASAGSTRPRGSPSSSNVFMSTDDEREDEDGLEEAPTRRAGGGGRRNNATAAEAGEKEAEEDEQQPEKTIPRDLLTRLLHEFFAKDSTRISREANAAVGKYVDVFVREAIARTAVEKRGGFLEVEDLEKMTPQLLMDL